VHAAIPRAFIARVSEKRIVTIQDRLASASFRGPGFDHIRLAAAVTVLLHHARGLQYSNVQDDPLLHYTAGFMDFGRLAVVVFFSISGFLVTPGLLRTGSVLNYAVNRCVRIFPGLVANVAITILVLGPCLTTYSLWSYFGDPRTYFYAKNILTLMVDHLPGVVTVEGQPASINGALWTLHFEVLCYVVLGLLSLAGFLRRRWLVLALWSVTYLAYVTVEMHPVFASFIPARVLTFLNLYVYFGSGVLLYLYGTHIPLSKSLACTSLATLLLLSALGEGAIVMPICLPYLIVFCGLSSIPSKMPIARDLSYGVYLIHEPVILAFSFIFPNLHVWWVGAVGVFLVTLTLAHMSWSFIEEPALNHKKALSDWVRRGVTAIGSRLKLAPRASTAAASKVGNSPD
jgi:peptidoglycan/LPS O-acetylase OafA/YrhL